MADDEAEETEAPPDVPDEPDDDDEDEEGPPKPSRFAGKAKLFIIIGGVVVLLIGAGVGVYFSGLLDSLLGIEEEKSADPAKFVEGQVFYKLEDMTLNVNVRGAKPQFLKLGLTIVLVKEDDIPLVEALLPRISDGVVAYMSELRPDELAGSANFHKVREGLLLRVRAAAAPITVTNVLFSSVLIQ